MQILVVDDEKEIVPRFSQYFQNEIKNEIFQFHFVFSAIEALEFMRTEQKNQIELVLSDIFTPETYGLKLIKTLKANYPHLSIFTMTAHANEHNYRTALISGADDFITKPMNLRMLKQKILMLKRQYRLS